jgi:flagellar FliL protein
MAQAPKKANDANGSADASNKKKLLLLIGLAVVLVLVSVGGTVFALKTFAPSAPEAHPAGAATSPLLAQANYFEMTPNFTINFTVNGRQRYLQASVTLLYRDPALENLLSLHMPAIRNGLVMLFSSKNFEDLQTPEGKEQLRGESLAIIQALLQKEQAALLAAGATKNLSLATVEQVLFTNFVMQ